MFQRKLMEKQIAISGLRIGDCCCIFPISGHKKAFTLNRNCIDLVSSHYRPDNLSPNYVELPKSQANPFHYRLELDQDINDGRFVLKTIKGNAFWINGLAAREAYVERQDRLYLDDNKINFDGFGLKEMMNRHFDHPILKEQTLMESNLKILIQGETGTGKTYLARKIHEQSGRVGAFVGINLSSFNPQLIESELFGHKKGAFTGAYQEKMGAFKAAEYGTLFLDEIDSLPGDLQTKLLTFLDNNTFRRVGEIKENTINTRLIFSSGRPLEQLVLQGNFRRDFYFRLKSGHSVELSPLRNNIERIKEACQYFGLKHGVSFSYRLLEFYETLAWPGNLRQLFGHLEKKKVLTKGTKLDFDRLDEELLLQSSDLMDLDETGALLPLKDFKEEYVKKALSLCEGNVALAARKLQVSAKTVKAVLEKV